MGTSKPTVGRADVSEKPSPLFLVTLATIGTALFSPLTLEGIPMVVLIIPFALLATLLHNAEKGMTVGIGTSIACGIFIQAFDIWSVVGYALASTIAVLAYESIYPTKKDELNALIFLALGTLLVELFIELARGDAIFFRSEYFLGTTPRVGVQLVLNAIVLWIGISTWNPFTSTKKINSHSI